jgi:hypothetical protein
MIIVGEIMPVFGFNPQKYDYSLRKPVEKKPAKVDI